jgi:hypoxanthine-DNA glycosylase
MSANHLSQPLTRKSSFPPIVAPNTRLLILGSLPGERSLAEQRYYAHPQNRFWHLIGGVIGRDLQPLPYEARLAALLEAKVGLWDVVASASRTGSLDAAIREAEHNALADLTASLPDLRAVGFNGGTSTKIGTAQLAGTALALIALPSSSPAYASMRLAEKERRWRALREFLR